MTFGRLVRHWLTAEAAVHRAFPASALHAIERTIAAVESTHDGQVRFAIEPALDTASVLAGKPGSARAMEVFAELRVWDTEQNNGVLIYVLLADRDVEIVADRGIHGRAGADAWEAVCRRMELAFRDGRFEAGAVEGIRAVGEHLARHFPRTAAGTNELPDAPVVL